MGRTIALAAALAALTACGGGGAATPAPTVTVTVTAPAVTADERASFEDAWAGLTPRERADACLYWRARPDDAYALFNETAVRTAGHALSRAAFDELFREACARAA